MWVKIQCVNFNQLISHIDGTDQGIAAPRGGVRRSCAIVGDNQVAFRDFSILVSNLERTQGCRLLGVVSSIPPKHGPPADAETGMYCMHVRATCWTS